MKKYCHILFLFVAASLAISCEHKDLCYDHNHSRWVNVKFDWSKAPEAAPATMSLWLFPRDGGEALRYEFVERNGGRIRLPLGDYDALCLNSDTEGLDYVQTDGFETFEVKARTTDLLTSGMSVLGVKSDGAPRAEGTENERVVNSADYLWTDNLQGIAIEAAMADDTLVLYPESRTCHYRVEISGVDNLKYVRGVSATLSGMSSGWLPGAEALSAELATLPFAMAKEAPEGEDNTANEWLTGELQVFGHCLDGKANHAIVVYAVLADGTQHAYTLDAEEVTRQIHEAPGSRNVVIRLHGLPLPKPIVNGGGFQPTVDEWQEEHVRLEM